MLFRSDWNPREAANQVNETLDAILKIMARETAPKVDLLAMLEGLGDGGPELPMPRDPLGGGF